MSKHEGTPGLSDEPDVTYISIEPNRGAPGDLGSIATTLMQGLTPEEIRNYQAAGTDPNTQAAHLAERLREISVLIGNFDSERPQEPHTRSAA